MGSTRVGIPDLGSLVAGMRKKIAAVAFLIGIMLVPMAALAHPTTHNSCETQTNNQSHGIISDGNGFGHRMSKVGYSGIRFDPYDTIKYIYDWTGPPVGGYWKLVHYHVALDCFDWS
jgi:hypothetical protein